MSVLKIARDIKLLEKQLKEIETQVSDPIERLEHKKLLEKKIKKLERLKSQQEEYERQQQELEELKSEFSPDNSNSVEHLQEISTSVNNKINSQPQHNLNQQFNSTVNSDNKITSKHLFIIGIIFSCVSATALIINYSLSKQAEEIRLKNLAQQQAQQIKQEAQQARLQELARQAAYQAQEEIEKARQEQIKAQREKEEAEKVRQAAIIATKKAQQQLEDSIRMETNISIPSSHKQETININNPQAQIDKLADRTFYSRYPELRGRKISADETFLKQEWLKIRNCEAIVDYLFYQRHPELRERKIFPGETNLAQEWLKINRNTSGCNY
ncbi:hypothetical protein NIES4102_06890 [Chondrocystis sp. NIES-4102]|nr:hypothetical protein NIES4102_06890 [Chondrocystis sp. NIES-4102]